MSEMALPATPYKGLMPYSEEDAPFFFGREAEREIITANLMASRLTVFYGASGVGKSSVLRAGVTHHLRQLARQNLAERGSPEFAVVVFSSWRDDPLAGLKDHVKNSVARALDGQTFEPVPPSPTLAQTLQAWTERVGGDLLIILDQFEEYFLYHLQEDGEGTFAVEFPRAVNRPDLRVSFLVSIREDSLAKLDRFKGRIPNLFDNYLRIEHLDREAARAAIEKPIEQYNRLRAANDQPISIEPALVDAVLEQVRTGQVILGEAGRGIVGRGLAPTQIETPYLQLVMTRLWEEEMRAGSRTLQLETLNRLGGAEQIVKRHLDAALSALPPREQEAAARVFHHLVTPSGTKIAHTVPDLAEYAELAETQVMPLLDKLSGPEVRILRPVAPPPDRPDTPCYEIFHDVLAPAILDWRARFVRAQERDEAAKRAAQEEKATQQRRTARFRLGAFGAIAVLIIAVLGIGLWSQRQLAQQAQTAATAEAGRRQTAEAYRVDAVIAQAATEAERNSVAALAANLEAMLTVQASSAKAVPEPPTATRAPSPTDTPTGAFTPPPEASPTATPTASPTPTPNQAATATVEAVQMQLAQVRATQTAVAQDQVTVLVPLGESPYIFGLHDAGGEHLMAEAGRRGWVLITEEIGDDPKNHAGRSYDFLADDGFGVIVQLINGIPPNGTIPHSSRYDDFAQRCANFVEGSKGCHIWVIGYEPNLSWERPGGPNGQVITPDLYTQCYLLCREKITALDGHNSDQVVVAAVRPWNIDTKYPENPSGDWVKYFRHILDRLVGQCDGIAIHTYTNGYALDFITKDYWQGAPGYTHLRYQFRSYIDFMDAIPEEMRSLPVYITETNQNLEWKDELGSKWVQTAYQEIDRWNSDPNNQKIRALLLYRWSLVRDEPQWAISTRPHIINDFKAAMDHDYRWR